MKKIIAAVDFTDVTNSVLDRACELTRALNGTLTILHTEPPEVDLLAYPVPEVVALEPPETADQDMQTLEHLQERVAGQNVHGEFLLLRGPTAEVIAAEARKLQADLIVIGSHQHGQFFHMLFGGVRDGLIAKASCPVMVVPCVEE